MPTTYATEELRDLMESRSGLPRPDRRSLFYLVWCPLDEEPCSVTECESGSCASMTTAEDLDGHLEPAAIIHIAPVPGPSERHAPAPIENENDWRRAVREAALLMDEEQLEALQEADTGWLEPADEKESRSSLLEAVRTLVECADDSDAQQCETCRKRHLDHDAEDCPGCTRLQDHSAPRFGFPGNQNAHD